MIPISTIGYEKTLQGQVLERLSAAGVELLIDVRAVAASRRAGFSKTLLASGVRDAGMEYLHLRDLGTPKAGRQAARAGRVDEMRTIFEAHLKGAAAQGALAHAAALSAQRHVCLLCYEADPACCHRAVVAAKMSAETGARVIHL